MEKPFCYFSERFCSSLAQKIDFNSKKLRWQRFPNVTQREVLMVVTMVVPMVVVVMVMSKSWEDKE